MVLAAPIYEKLVFTRAKGCLWKLLKSNCFGGIIKLLNCGLFGSSIIIGICIRPGGGPITYMFC